MKSVFLMAAALVMSIITGSALAATPCDTAVYPDQCGYYDSGSLPPYVHDAIIAKGGTIGPGSALVLTSGNPGEASNTISNDMAHGGCGTNPDGWQTYDCNILNSFIPPQDSIVLALSSEWFEWYQTIFTDWMTISGSGIPTVDVSINSWINSKVDIIPYGPMDTGVVILTSLSQSKMIDLRVADSGDHIYDTAIVIVPASWLAGVGSSGQDKTLLCGNGKLEPGEDCDDGNTIADDGCNSLCLGNQTPGIPPAIQTCGNLVYTWPAGNTSPYTCGSDLCMGYRCVEGNTISPACYTAAQCSQACAGSCVDIQTAQSDCKKLCAIQPPATSPPATPVACSNLAYAWPDGTTMPYSCNDTCTGQRCVIGTTISPGCYASSDCSAICAGACVNLPAPDCSTICSLGDAAASKLLGDPCTTPGETRLSSNQKGACLGNQEICNATTKTWQKDGDLFLSPEDELCDGIDNNCNGIVDDMFETCGDPGLCQNTVNTCDPNNPKVPIICKTLPAPSPFDICKNGLDDDCDGSADDGCANCGDGFCDPSEPENYLNCPAALGGDCMPPVGTACDDGSICTVSDVYDGNGICAGIQNCSSVSLCDKSTNCDDGDPCTIDACDPALGCQHSPDPSPSCQDADQDGYPFYADCNDTDASVHPGAPELCNGRDDDCDSIIDEGYNAGASCQGSQNSCKDTNTGQYICDSDGLGTHCDASTPPERAFWNQSCSSTPNSCGDTNQGLTGCDGACGASTPSERAVWNQPCTSTPNSCGETSQGVTDCGGICQAQTPADPPGYNDACSSQPNACDDTSQGKIQCDGTCGAVPPAALDSDNDETPDCLDQCPSDPEKTSPGLCGCGAPDILNTYYHDADHDGYGNALNTIQACAMPAGYAAVDSDCDDAEASVNPGAPEVCDKIDNNCNGLVDENVDIDKDGIEDCKRDLCLGTRADSQYIPKVPLLWLNKNRWVLVNSSGIFEWESTKMNKDFRPTISYTDGCSCRQILDNLSTMKDKKLFRQHPENLLAQYLFGCTKNTLEDWHEQN